MAMLDWRVGTVTSVLTGYFQYKVCQYIDKLVVRSDETMEMLRPAWYQEQ